jgi:MFS transporter, ACS family, hexuronate transporter
MTQRRGIFTYENGLLLLLGFSWGVAFFDRQAAFVLTPWIEKDLQLNNTQIGFIGSSLAMGWALGAYLIARWSDAVGSRKPFLIAFLIIFSACSVLSGLAQSFEMLIAARFVMGLVEGPFLPVCLAIMILSSSENRRGVNAGIMQNFFAALLGQSVAPLVLVPLAEAFGWRAAFYIAGIPGLLCAIAVLLWVREPSKAAQASLDAHLGTDATPARMPFMQMIRVRNIALCCAISVFLVGWMIVGWQFLPTFFVNERGFSPQTMGYLMTTLGFASALSGFGAPAISDRIGRKPIMITFCLAGVITPLAALYFQGSTVALGALMFIGWTATGAFPLFMGVIPGETIPAKYAATAMGLVVCAGEVVGGFGITSLAGKIADLSSRETAILMQAGCALIGGLLCFFLVETAPAKIRAVAAQRVEVAKAA